MGHWVNGCDGHCPLLLTVNTQQWWLRWTNVNKLDQACGWHMSSICFNSVIITDQWHNYWPLSFLLTNHDKWYHYWLSVWITIIDQCHHYWPVSPSLTSVTSIDQYHHYWPVSPALTTIVTSAIGAVILALCVTKRAAVVSLHWSLAQRSVWVFDLSHQWLSMDWRKFSDQNRHHRGDKT